MGRRHIPHLLFSTSISFTTTDIRMFNERNPSTIGISPLFLVQGLDQLDVAKVAYSAKTANRIWFNESWHGLDIEKK